MLISDTFRLVSDDEDSISELGCLRKILPIE